MNVEQQIEQHIASQPESRIGDIRMLHQRIIQLLPGSKFWFLDGKDAQGKVVTNPDIGYGSQLLKYADGSTKEFYQVGISPTKTGISVYLMGIKDKTFLMKTCGDKIGKATVTGYCIKFKSLKDINLEVLETTILAGIEAQGE